MQGLLRSVGRAVLVSALGAIALVMGVSAQTGSVASCDRFLATARDVRGQKVGPASCLMQDTALTIEGRAFRRLDIGLDGSVDGFVTRTGDYKEYLTNAPDLVFPQTADAGERFFAVAKYQRDKGAAMTVIFPSSPGAWNGKNWVTVHGRGTSFKEGNLKAWDQNLDPARPLAGLNKYDLLMLSKGFALVKTRRTSSEGLGEILATLDNGTTVDDVAFNDSARYIMDFASVAHNLIADRLGRRPSRTYLYGHSAGARIGRGLNYTPGLNRDRDGGAFFDGILADDGAAGGWLPVLMKDGKDVLLTTDADRAAFVPQLDISHQMYNNIWPSKKPDYMSSSYLANKRSNARILAEKGLTAKHRMYEVRSISHSGGENLPDGRRGAVQILDMSKVMDRFIDMLDAWVDRGIAPPASRSDAPDTSGRAGANTRPALAFPEVACPLGVYFPYPNSVAGTTSFAAFTGHGLEPLDASNVFVDMNRNGVWDERESPTQAWRRLGLLPASESLTRNRYVECVQAAGRALVTEGFMSDANAAWYADQARQIELVPVRSSP
ncbi:MAG: alpha/beta hydrolase domain-containing protein [Acidobacteriota bacterium]|nr:alpha/beta hydrolase domain-containing protein [Acidobacteriota bacterium]